MKGILLFMLAAAFVPSLSLGVDSGSRTQIFSVVPGVLEDSVSQLESAHKTGCMSVYDSAPINSFVTRSTSLRAQSQRGGSFQNSDSSKLRSCWIFKLSVNQQAALLR